MAGRGREAWNEEDVATLRRLAVEGADVAMMARTLERTREAVQNRARKLGIVIAPGNYRKLSNETGGRPDA